MRHVRGIEVCIACAITAALAGCGTGASDGSDVLVNVQGLASVSTGDSESGAAIIQIKGVPQSTVDTSGVPGSRHFYLGAVPIGAPGPGVTEQVLDDAIKFTAQRAECFVIRQKVDWEAFRPGGIAEPDFTIDIIKLLNQARAAGFTKTLVELDPIVDRHTIGPLPPAIAHEKFDGPSVRQALMRQAIEVVTKAKPDFLSLGVEVNGYYESEPDDFMNFVSLHKEIYDQVKAIDPHVLVMPSFNLEALQGLLSGLNDYSTHGPQWFLIDLFEPKLDAVAFSTLPFPVLYRPIQMPKNYILQIQDYTNKPIILSEVGWTTSVQDGSDEQQQREYVAMMTRQALRTPQLRVLAWTIYFDAADGSIFDAFPAFKYLGLLSPDGNPKPAFDTWVNLHSMPLVLPEGV